MLIPLGAFSVRVGKLVRVVPLVIPVKSFSVFIQYNIFFNSITRPVKLLTENWFVTLIINNAILYAEQQPCFVFQVYIYTAVV